jgi:hypothetical protein
MSLGSNRQRLSIEIQMYPMFHRPVQMRLLFPTCDWSLLHIIVKRHRGNEKGLLKVAPEMKRIPFVHFGQQCKYITLLGCVRNKPKFFPFTII